VLLAGIAAAQGELVIMGDTDGSHDFSRSETGSPAVSRRKSAIERFDRRSTGI
jgi:hypothetical protein